MKKNPKNAGRKLEFGEPSKRETFRLPASQSDRIKKVFNRYLNKFKK